VPMLPLRLRSIALLGLLAGLSAAGCSEAADDGGESDEAAVTELKAYWADAKKLDLGDLTRVAVGFASDSLNDAISTPNFGAKFDRPTVFAAQAEPNKILPDNTEIKALSTVVSGLGARFGEHELGTEVNKVRLDHLQSGKSKYFVESGFALRAGLAHGWNFDASGILDGAGISLGFKAGGELQSRVIVASDDDHLLSLLKAPLAAIKEMRGFVYPRSVEDIKKMKPGEMFALRGLGNLGGNFGIGVPLLVAEPTGGMVYRIVASAGVSGYIGGQVDVQLVRLAGDEVVVDVGVENANAWAFQAAIRDGWGIKGICDDGLRCLREVDLGVTKVDLARMVEKAVEKRMNQYLTFKIEGGASKTSTRTSLSRLHFHLDKGDPEEVNRALEHALKLDIRLAQALYNRDLDQKDPAVEVEFDAVRAATTSTRNFGFELLGMNIYHRTVVNKEGTFVVQTPDGVRSILFDSVNKHGGWFQMDHGYTRTGVGAQTLDRRDPDSFRSEANLFLQTNVGDAHMDDDFMIDSADALILALAGPGAVEALDKSGNEMQRLIWSVCPVKEENDGHGGSQTRTWDEACNVRLLDDPRMQQLKAQGMADLEAQLGDLPDDYKKVVREAANTRLVLQSVGIHSLDATNGPNSSIAVDMRFDDKALDILTSRSKDQFKGALREYLAAVYADRNKVGKDMSKDDVRAQVDKKWGKDMDRVAKVFEKQARAYRLIVDAEKMMPVALAGKRFVSFPLGLRFSVEGDKNKQYESAVLQSTSHERALAAAKLFDDLYHEADRINAPLYDEHTAAMPLLALVPPQNLELAVDIKADSRSTFWNRRERFQKAGFRSVSVAAKGADVSTISAGMFDLNAIINAQ
jgi:hypothetical protein